MKVNSLSKCFILFLLTTLASACGVHENSNSQESSSLLTSSSTSQSSSNGNGSSSVAEEKDPTIPKSYGINHYS